MVVAEAYLPIIFAAVFEVWSETVMSINSWQPLALNQGQKLVFGGQSLSIGHVLLKPSGR